MNWDIEFDSKARITQAYSAWHRRLVRSLSKSTSLTIEQKFVRRQIMDFKIATPKGVCLQHCSQIFQSSNVDNNSQQIYFEPKN